MAGRPFFSKILAFEYYKSWINENNAGLTYLNGMIDPLDSLIERNASLKIINTIKNNKPLVVYCDSTNLSFWNNKYYSKNEISRLQIIQDIYSTMKELDLYSLTYLNKQILIKPRLSKYYFSDTYILLPESKNSLSLVNPKSFPNGDNFWYEKVSNTIVLIFKK